MQHPHSAQLTTVREGIIAEFSENIYLLKQTVNKSAGAHKYLQLETGLL